MWTFDIEYCGMVNSVHPQYFSQCFKCGNKLNTVAHSISTVYKLKGYCTATHLASYQAAMDANFDGPASIFVNDANEERFSHNSYICIKGG